MDNPSGGNPMTESEHEVKTLDTAINWYSDVTELDLPILVRQWKASNGRIMYWVYNCDKKLLHKHG